MMVKRLLISILLIGASTTLTGKHKLNCLAAPAQIKIGDPRGETADSAASAADIMRSAWKRPDVTFQTARGPGLMREFLSFEEDGTVTDLQISEVPQTDISCEIKQVGKYRIEGQTLYFDVPPSRPGCTINGNTYYENHPGYWVTAVIDGDEIKGIITKKDTHQKLTWIVERVPPDQAAPDDAAAAADSNQERPSSGDSAATAADLMRSAWKRPDGTFQTAQASGSTREFLGFGENGTVWDLQIAYTLSHLKPVPNYATPGNVYYPYSLRLITVPGLSCTNNQVGKYRIQGKTLYLDVPPQRTSCTLNGTTYYENHPGYWVTAVIDGDEIKGVITKKDSLKKLTWVVNRVPPKQ
jgi:hypothetical protein